MTAMAQTPARTALRLDWIALLGAMSMYVVLLVVASAKAGWVFEYPLDDPYIHLAMASEIARGGYGVNQGEIASAASSGLFPLLLLFAPDTELQRLLPFFWNIVGLSLTAILWGRALMWSGYRGGFGLAVAFFGPLLVGGVSTAYVGMEHTLHAAASVAIVYGLAKYLVEGRLSVLIFVGVLFAPILRLEGLALATMAILTLAVTRRPGAALVAAALAFVPVAIFVAYLLSLGLDPLPNSVQAKLVSNDDLDLGRFDRMVQTFVINLSKPGGRGSGRWWWRPSCCGC